jgi:maltoporin
MKELSNSSGQSRKPEDEAKTYMYALTKVQQAHYQEVGKFATAIEEVSIGLKTETESYRYQIVPQGDEKQSVMVTAQAKNTELPSYTGVVFVTRVNGEATTVAQICETESPSTSPPAMPEAPARGSSAIQCPAGSRSLQ